MASRSRPPWPTSATAAAAARAPSPLACSSRSSSATSRGCISTSPGRPTPTAIRRTSRHTTRAPAPRAARLIDAAFALVYLRLLGRTDVGAYTFLVVFTTYLDTLVDFGLNALL